ncbi:unnamed protein product [Schistosoma turkestanicum]|nr:unnamed protein product [Schistosoma turkestanicum]
MMQFHWLLIYSNIIITLLLITYISSDEIPTVIYNLADETPTGSLIGNIAENLSPDYAKKSTFLFISSIKLQHLSDFFKLTPNGDLITLRHIDRDDTNDICGPLDCCSSVVCQIEANIILTKQWDTHWKSNSYSTKSVFMKQDPPMTHNYDNKKVLTQHSMQLNESNQQTTVRLYIRINDANDNPPRFMSTSMIKYNPSNIAHQLVNRPFVIYIREGDTTGYEGLPIASDADSEVNGIVMYKLIEQTNKEPRLNISIIYGSGNSMHPHNLNPKLILLRSLDYENVDDREIYATLYAIDGGDPSLTGSLSIVVRLLDINDNSPVIKYYTDAERLIVLPENTTMNDKPFFIVNATDVDSGDNGRLTYSFSPLVNSLVQTKFTIDSRNGAITIREPLDYEIYSERQFLLPIIVKDAGHPQLSSSLSIYVQIKDMNDNIPMLVVQENITIPEGQVFTKPIIRFYIRDEDEVSHGNVICKPAQLGASHLQDKELKAGQDYLRLHAVSDTVFFVFTKGVLDYEKIPRAALLIECLDLAGVEQVEKENFTQKSQEQPTPPPVKPHLIRITAAVRDQNDNMPLFTQTKYYVKIPEHFPEGSLVTEIKAHDLDSGEYGQLTYQLGPITTESGVLIDTFNVEGDQHTQQHRQQQQQPFQVDQSTGVIRVLHSHLLDREQTEFLYLSIIATDKGGLTSTAQLIIELIDINDNLPKLISSTELKFEENQKINTFIDFIHLIDLDKGRNSRIHLKLINDQHPKLNEMTNYVKILPDLNFNYSQSTLDELINDGELKALLVSQSLIDRETTATIFCEIITYDESVQQLVHSVTHTISIRILDQNDNIPMCTYPIYDSIIGYHPVIHTNTPVHSLVTQIRGYDPDQGLNGTILYKLNKSTNGSVYFYLNESTGELFTNWYSNSHFPPDYNNIQTNITNIEPNEGIYHLKILLQDMGTPPLSKETQFYIKINAPNPNFNEWRSNNLRMTHHHQTNQSISSNLKIPFWLNNNHNRFVLISLIIFTMFLILIIAGTLIWIRTHCKQKSSRSVKTMIISSNETECNPIIISTTSSIKNGGFHKNMETLPIINYDGILDQKSASSVKQRPNSHLTSTIHEPVSKTEHIDSSIVSREEFAILNNNNTSVWPNINTLDRFTNRNVKAFDQHNTYSPHFSINDNFKITTTTTTSTATNASNNNYNNYNNHIDSSGYNNHLHSTQLCSFPYTYEIDNYNSSNHYYNYHQPVGQNLSSVNLPNIHYSTCDRNSNQSNITLNNNGFHQNDNVYLQSPIQRLPSMKRNPMVYSSTGNAYSQLTSMSDFNSNDQFKGNTQTCQILVYSSTPQPTLPPPTTTTT